MATANWQANQPTNLNYLSPVNFELLIEKIPKTRYNRVGATLPSINFSEATFNTPLAVESLVPGDKITFDPLTVRFIVDEDMKNYQEIYNWIMKLGPGIDTDDYQSLVNSTKTSTGKFSNADFSQMYSDCILIVNTSSNNANLEIQFVDAFPTSLGSIDFVTDASEVEYAVCELTLRYTFFKISEIG